MTDPQAQAQARDALTAARDAAKDFAKQHVAELAKNINQWQDTGLLPAGCRLRELHAICRPLGNSDTMALAEAFADRACRDVAALASAPAAEPAISAEDSLRTRLQWEQEKVAELEVELRELRGKLPGAAERDAKFMALLAAPTPQDTVPAARQLPDEVPDAVIEATAEALGDALDCTRHWSAWSYGTMCADDFPQVAEDGDRVAEIARACIGAWIATAHAAQPAAQAEPRVDDLAHTVRKLAHALRQAAPINDLPAKAMDYLKRHGLQGSPLRATPPSPTEQQQPLEPDTASLAMSGRSTDYISGYERGFEAGVDAARAAQDKKGGE